MSSARDEILNKIRRAVADSPQLPYADVSRSYRESRTFDSVARLDYLEDRLHDYGVAVCRCTERDVAAVIGEVMVERGKHSLLIPSGFPSRYLPAQLKFRVADNLSYDDLNLSDGVLTGCALAIAATGTIVLRHTEGEGRRALTLIPDYHLCVVRAAQVVETPVEGIRIMAEFAKVPITTVSGPSATSDIEMIRVKGVHGPRVLDVILVS